MNVEVENLRKYLDRSQEVLLIVVRNEGLLEVEVFNNIARNGLKEKNLHGCFLITHHTEEIETVLSG